LCLLYQYILIYFKTMMISTSKVEPINCGDIHLLSQALKACGDPLRLQILQVLQFETFGVLELTQLFNTKQSGMSHHLKVLSQSSLVEAQREGNAVFYRRPVSFDSQRVKSTTEQLFSLVDQCPLDQSLQDKIKCIQEQRAVQSQAFFSRNADRFHEQQELIAKHSLYAQASFELLLQEQRANLAEQTIIEFGPGEGHFLRPLSETYKSVIAIDNSQDMLNKARAFALSEGLNNITFELGDTHSYKNLCNKNERPQVDAAVMNMVLHHVPAPAQIFIDVYAILKPGSSLVICDLAHHNQEWARESCGDLWLGFEAQELLSWAERA
ncbi:hypothetical protein A3749_17210, partial [Oleiphilus sp. HI0078]